jgi:phosphoribosylformylglycinamidine synthase
MARAGLNFRSDQPENDAALVTVRYVDNYGQVTESYPDNPNGSIRGITGLTTPDGRFSVLMPHPERVFRIAQHSWHPLKSDLNAPEDAPWMRLFRNARKWVGRQQAQSER